MIATVCHVTSSLGCRKFQAAWFLLNRVYNIVSLITFKRPLGYVYSNSYAHTCIYWEVKKERQLLEKGH